MSPGHTRVARRMLGYDTDYLERLKPGCDGARFPDRSGELGICDNRAFTPIGPCHVSVRPTFSARHHASRSIHVVATGSHPPLGPRGAPSLRGATSLCPTIPRRAPGRLPCAGRRDGGRSGHRGAGVLSTSCFGFLRVTAQTWTRWATGLETTIPRTCQPISGVAEICHGPGRRFVVPCPLPAAL